MRIFCYIGEAGDIHALRAGLCVLFDGSQNTEVYCTFKFIRFLFVEVTNRFLQLQYPNIIIIIIKKWPYKKTKQKTTPTLGSPAKHPCNTMADII